MIDGKTVADCFALVARYGTELNALNDALENLLTENLTADKKLPCALAADAESDYRCSESDFVYTDMAYSLPLKSKGKRKVEGYLGFQISMTGDGIGIPGNAEPLLHVFCWNVPVNFDETPYIGFPLDSDSEYPFTIFDERLVLWGQQDGNWNDREWTYSLRLMHMNSIDDLKKYVVTPALGLLKGENVADVLLDEWLGKTLIRYPETV